MIIIVIIKAIFWHGYMLVSHSDKIVKVFDHIVSTRALDSNTDCDNVQYDESKEVGAMSRERIHVFCLVRVV